MVFNAHTYKDELHRLKSYTAAPAFLGAFGWSQDGSANILMDKQDKELAILIVVGKVVHDRVYCGPSGNWSIGNSYGSLKEAKCQLTICRPDEEVFAKEFDNAFKTIGKIQSTIASNQDRRNLLIGESELINNIRFSAPLFEQRPAVSTAYVLEGFLNITNRLFFFSPSKSQMPFKAFRGKPSAWTQLTRYICPTFL